MSINSGNNIGRIDNSNNTNAVDSAVTNSYNTTEIKKSEDERKSIAIRHDRLLTVQEISDFLNVPQSYIYYWLTHQKKIPHLKIHGHLRFWRSAINEWLKAQEVS
ncbi:TPA: DNA-binding protein [bacterium]|nr:DNA-binding protein [bacterium]